MSYSHLTIDQRNHLYQLRQEQNLSQRELATLVGCSQSTICRELQRNKTEQGWYVPDKAQVLTDKRRKDSKKKFNNITDWILHEVKTRLKDYHSPEQISGKLKKEGGEWIRGYASKFSNLHLARVLKFLMKSRQSLKALPSLVFTN